MTFYFKDQILCDRIDSLLNVHNIIERHKYPQSEKIDDKIAVYAKMISDFKEDVTRIDRYNSYQVDFDLRISLVKQSKVAGQIPSIRSGVIALIYVCSLIALSMLKLSPTVFKILSVVSTILCLSMIRDLSDITNNPDLETMHKEQDNLLENINSKFARLGHDGFLYPTPDDKKQWLEGAINDYNKEIAVLSAHKMSLDSANVLPPEITDIIAKFEFRLDLKNREDAYFLALNNFCNEK